MDSDNGAPTSEDELTLLSSPRFDSAAASMAHSVVPLENLSDSTSSSQPRKGLLPAMRHVRPSVLVVASVLIAAAIVGAAALYKHQQATTAPAFPQLSDAPGSSLASEEASSRKETTPVASPKRRPKSGLGTPSIPSRRMEYPTQKEEVLGAIREILTERSRSRGKGHGKDKHGDDHEDN